MSFRKLKISYSVRNRKAIPKIVLAGEWLKLAGFEAGAKIKVEIVNNKLIINNAD